MAGRDYAKVLRSMAIGAFASTWMAAPAQPSEYACRVPRALLCKGCASQIVIALQPGGGCRISFSPAASPASDADQDQLDFRVSATPTATARVPAGLHSNMRRHRVAVARQIPMARCFVFNAQKYCE
jgi:hypothetical protein